MNSSGSEFTLRVAICDLVEQLKRMQHKCSYLEECRNQLVKEVIRLQSQNEWSARQLGSESPEISSLTQNAHCFCNQSPGHHHQNLVNSNSFNKSSNPLMNFPLNGQDILNNSSNSHDSNSSERSSEIRHSFGQTKNINSNNLKDESSHLINILNELDHDGLENRENSIRQITIQMLKDLDHEMKTGKLKSDLIDFIRNNTDACKTVFNDNVMNNDLIEFEDNKIDNDNRDRTFRLASNHCNNETNEDEFEAFNVNSVYYTNSHHLNFPLKVAERSDFSSQQIKPMVKKSDSISKNNEEIPSTLTAVKKSIDNRNINSDAISSTNREDQDQQLLSIIAMIKKDMKDIHQGIVSSTDKLNKIKTKQLRYFFQKQINLDNQNNASETNANRLMQQSASCNGTSSSFRKQQ